ncbi:Tol-Pal system beta propeller repeat protein TolB [bacterium]|nr:Tol-Pal system beta propeller repeat protein TolB [candidate division CSSED10-310 bacterium]
MIKNLRLTAVILPMLLLGQVEMVPPVWSAEVYFDITAAPTRRIDIALPMLNSGDPANKALREEIHQTFKQDLEFSGRFNVIDIARFFPVESSEITNPDFQAWYLIGIQALVTGNIQSSGSDYEISFRLFDIPMGQQIVGKKYRVSLSGVRSVVHKFADETQFRLTGERGINFSRIAFTCKRTGNMELYLVDPDGGNLVQLTRNGTINLSPAWSPDGAEIYFTSYIQDRPDLYEIKLDDHQVNVVLSGGMHITPSVSHDGGTVLLSASYDGDPEIIRYDIDSKKISRLTFSTGVDTNPVFAPNGREIAFTSDRSGTPQIYLMDIEGTNIRRLTRIGDYNTSPDWSPRGDWIAYHSRRNGVFDIWLIHPDGTDEHPITSEAGHNEDPSWARNGRHIAFISTREGGKGLYIMDQTGRSVKPVVVHQGICGNPSWSR